VRRGLILLAVLAVGGSLTCGANAALLVDRATSAESLKVAANGSVQITWASRGQTRTLVVSGQTLKYGGTVKGANRAAQVTPTVPYAIAQYQLPNGEQFALQKVQRLGDLGQLGPVELYLARWSGAPTQLTLTTSRDGRVCGTVSYHGAAVYGGPHTTAGNPLDKLGRNVYIDALKPGGWWRVFGVLARPLGFALYLKPQYAGSQYRALVVGPNTGGDLAPIAAASTPANAGGSCPFAKGTYKGM
jgi:hypothetical protein